MYLYDLKLVKQDSTMLVKQDSTMMISYEISIFSYYLSLPNLCISMTDLRNHMSECIILATKGGII